jgi:hypothetical protein
MVKLYPGAFIQCPFSKLLILGCGKELTCIKIEPLAIQLLGLGPHTVYTPEAVGVKIIN